MRVIKRHFKDDFDFKVRLLDGCGKELGVPDWDWEIRVRTTRTYGRCFVASQRGGVMTNCYRDGGRIHVVCDNHGLEPGLVQVEFAGEVPDGAFGDGSRLTVVPEMTQIELVRGAGDLPRFAEVEMMLPTIKGEAFRYEDFTEEQIEGLRRPAVEAAEEAREAAEEARAAAEAAGGGTGPEALTEAEIEEIAAGAAAGRMTE